MNYLPSKWLSSLLLGELVVNGDLRSARYNPMQMTKHELEGAENRIQSNSSMANFVLFVGPTKTRAQSATGYGRPLSPFYRAYSTRSKVLSWADKPLG
jgi:hypothetical protein